MSTVKETSASTAVTVYSPSSALVPTGSGAPLLPAVTSPRPGHRGAADGSQLGKALSVGKAASVGKELSVGDGSAVAPQAVRQQSSSSSATTWQVGCSPRTLR